MDAGDRARLVRPPGTTGRRAVRRSAHHRGPARAGGARRRRRGPRHGALHRRARAARRGGGVRGMSTVRRKTRETTIEVKLVAGTGPSSIDTGEPFLDHMLGSLARYAGLE